MIGIIKGVFASVSGLIIDRLLKYNPLQLLFPENPGELPVIEKNADTGIYEIIDFVGDETREIQETYGMYYGSDNYSSFNVVSLTGDYNVSFDIASSNSTTVERRLFGNTMSSYDDGMVLINNCVYLISGGSYYNLNYTLASDNIPVTFELKRVGTNTIFSVDGEEKYNSIYPETYSLSINSIGASVDSSSNIIDEAYCTFHNFHITKAGVLEIEFRMEAGLLGTVGWDLDSSGNENNAFMVNFTLGTNRVKNNRFRSFWNEYGGTVQEYLGLSARNIRIDGSLNVVLDGDSITTGSRVTIDNSYPEQLKDMLATDTNTFEYLSFAHGGDTTEDLTARANTLDNKLTTTCNKLIVMVGRNDWSHFTSITQEDLYDRINTYVQARVLKGWDVYVMTLLPSLVSTHSGFETARTWVNNKMLSDMNCKGVINLTPTVIGGAGDNNNTTYYHSDKIHPIAAGYTVMATAIKDYIYKNEMLEFNSRVKYNTKLVNANHIRLDGSAGKINLDSHISKVQNLSQGSIEITFKADANTIGMLFSASHTTTAGNELTVYRDTSRKLQVLIRTAGAYVLRWGSNTILTNGVWYTFKYESTVTSNEMYINGVATAGTYTVGSDTIPAFFTEADNCNTFRIGNRCNDGGDGYTFPGSLSSFKITSEGTDIMNMPLQEGGGVYVFDKVDGMAGIVEDADITTIWDNDITGFIRPSNLIDGFSTALSFDGVDDYVEFPTLDISNLSYFHISIDMEKHDATDYVCFQQYIDNTHQVKIAWHPNGNFYALVYDGVASLGYVDIVGEGRHTATVVFQGSETGNEDRLQISIDGVQQTLGFTGTLPSSTPNLSSVNPTLGISGASDFEKGIVHSLSTRGLNGELLSSWKRVYDDKYIDSIDEDNGVIHGATRLFIPAKNSTTDVYDKPLTNPSGSWHNNSENTIENYASYQMCQADNNYWYSAYDTPYARATFYLWESLFGKIFTNITNKPEKYKQISIWSDEQVDPNLSKILEIIREGSISKLEEYTRLTPTTKLS